MRLKKVLCVVLVLMMLFTTAACGTGNGGNTGNNTTNSEKGVRLDENGNLLFRPEDIGELDNPIVTTLVAGADEQWCHDEFDWREELYGMEVKYDIAPWEEREAKWISSYVSGSAYDILFWINFPTAPIKGLLEPVENHLPLEKTEYFKPGGKWNGVYYGTAVYPIGYDDSMASIGGIYGVFYNKDIFQDNGQPLPGDLYDNGEWTFEAMYDAAKNLTMDTDRDGKNDIIGLDNYVYDMFTTANGAATAVLDDQLGIRLDMNTPAYVEGLEWLIKFKPYMAIRGSFANGSSAMYVERLGNTLRYVMQDADIDFEWDWVPYPKGPSGEGYTGGLSTGTETWYIGKGAKNIEGAKAFICADLLRYDHTEKPTNEKFSEDIRRRANDCLDHFVKDYAGSVGSMGDKLWNMWTAAPELGAKAAVEKYIPVFQKEIDNLLTTEKVPDPVAFKSPGKLDFEDGNTVLKGCYDGILTVTEDPAEVINGSKSLKVQLKPDNPYGPQAVTTAEHYAFSYGGQFKITFKTKAAGGTATPEGTLRVAFRPSAATDDSSDIGGYNAIDLTDGTVHEVEILINVLENVKDLQMFFIGGTDQSAPNLAVVIDDLNVEKIG